ncbi:MAG: hypothetical protein RLZZ91_1912 [Bacteroidota bacterium]|jgi:hypothetical protein
MSLLKGKFAPLILIVFLLLFLNEMKNEKQKDKQNEWRCVRDSSGKPAAVGNREDLERIARPEGARPTAPKEKLRNRKL